MNTAGILRGDENELARKLLADIQKRSVRLQKPVRLMEFCGTHTHNIFHFGFRNAFKPVIRFISGPGCPVCVTAEEELSLAGCLLERYNTGIIAYGDMLRVPANGRSLADYRAEGKTVEVVYSALDAVDIARKRPDRQWVFLGVGFETTIPATAAAIELAERDSIENLTFLSFHKNTRSVLKALADVGSLRADGVILPGHVSAVTGWNYFSGINDFGVPAVVTGFEPLDILAGISELVDMAATGQKGIRCAYKRVVDKKGNKKMMQKVDQMFRIASAPWRGLGVIEAGGYAIRDEYDRFDARKKYDCSGCPPSGKINGCRCGEVLIGGIEPTECPLFRTSCSPERPVGPCMVSHEGTCLAFYKWGDGLE